MEALAAVIVPVLLKAGDNNGIFYYFNPFGVSSSANSTYLSFDFITTGTISFLKYPASIAAFALW